MPRAGECLHGALRARAGHCPAKEKDMSFDTLGLHAPLTRAVADAGYDSATDVQARAIPPALS